MGNNTHDRVNKSKKKSKRKSKKSKTSPRQLQLAKKQVKALELRLKGKTFRAIALELKYRGPSGAFSAVESALKQILQQPAEELRQLELERLDALQVSPWILATEGADLKAVETVLSIMRRRAKLLGLDSPIEFTIDDIRAIARKVHLIINAEVADKAVRERIFDALEWTE